MSAELEVRHIETEEQVEADEIKEEIVEQPIVSEEDAKLAEEIVF